MNKYLELREQVLKYTNKDMNLKLDNNKEVYIAVFDIPIESIIEGLKTQTLALVFGLNTNLYSGTGGVICYNPQNGPKIIQTSMSLLISSSQVLNKMQLTTNTDYYESKNIRAYLKTGEGIYFHELDDKTKEMKFLKWLMNNVLNEIATEIKK